MPSATPTEFVDLGAEYIDGRARAAMYEVREMRYAGRLTSEGGPEVTVDMQASWDGGCRGTIGVRGGTAEVRAFAGDTWFRPDPAYWRATAGDHAEAIIAAVGDRWVHATDPAVESFCDLNTFFDGLVEDTFETSTYTKLGTSVIDGKQVVEVEQSGPEATVDLFVVIEGDHDVVKLVRRAGKETASLRFSDFDKTFSVDPPAAADVVELGAEAGATA
jgi:hypothetical protein